MNPYTIATEAGIATRETRSGMKNPPPIYAVCFESVENVGPDFEPSMLQRRTATVELYTKLNDSAAKAAAAALEDVMSAHWLEWSRSDRVWIEEEQIFQTVYTYIYFQKG